MTKTQMLWSLLFEDSQFLVLGQPCLWEQVRSTTEEQFCRNQYKSVLGHQKMRQFLGLHCLTGCDTCGHIKGILGKKTAFKTFAEATPAELSALSQLGLKKCLLLMLFQPVRGFRAGYLAQKRTYRPTHLKNGVSSLFRRVVIPKGHYSENTMTVIIPKGHYSENNIRVIIPKIT